MSALTVIMMMDSVCILSPLLHPVAEDYVPQRQGKKRDGDGDKYHVLHVGLLCRSRLLSRT